MLPDVYDTEINELNEIWEGIVQNWATSDEILELLEAYEQSEGFEILSAQAHSEYVVFKMLVKDELAKSTRPSRLLYFTVQHFLYGFGWNLED